MRLAKFLRTPSLKNNLRMTASEYLVNAYVPEQMFLRHPRGLEVPILSFLRIFQCSFYVLIKMEHLIALVLVMVGES